MAATLTPIEGAHRLRQFSFGFETIVQRELTLGLVRARKRATTVYMVRAPKTALPLRDKLTIRSGDLARTVKIIQARRIGDSFVGGLEAGGLNVTYAKIHEEGGKTGAHDILPLKGDALRWVGIGPAARGPRGSLPRGPKSGGHYIFAKRVHHPGSRIPPRPYIRPSLEDEAPLILAGIDRGLTDLRDRLGMN